MKLIRYEEVELGVPTRSAGYVVPRDEVIEYARKWDPQPWHLDDAAAAKTLFGRISACFSHVFAIMGKLTMDQPARLDVVAGLGFEDCMMTSPVYPGDELVLESEVVDKRPSRSKPDRGIVTTRFSLRNQRGVEVFRGQGRAMVVRTVPDETAEPAER